MYGSVEWDDRLGHHHHKDTVNADEQRRLSRMLRRSGRRITRTRRFG